MNILVIDDEEVFRKLMVALLKLDGHEVLTADDGEMGIAEARKSYPDIILLDCMMPGMDGFKTCEKFKGDTHLKDIPVIMLTALDKVGDVERAFDAGADEYISKPVNEAHFNETLLRKYNRINRQK